MTLIVRAETPGDRDAIRAVHEVAFPTPQEADLVDALRVDDDLVLSLVAIEDGAIVGHIAFSRMTVKSDTGEFAALALAPVAVIPEFQREGVGSTLIENGLELLAKKGEKLVFVLGEPDYYGRFGFQRETRIRIYLAFSRPLFPVAAIDRRCAGLRFGALCLRLLRVVVAMPRYKILDRI